MGMVICFAHNDSVFYVMFRFSDQNLARKVHMRGAILWMDPQTDEEKKWAILDHLSGWSGMKNYNCNML